MPHRIAANHKNNKGLLLKCTALQENVNYFWAEHQAVTFKYEIVKKRLCEEKKGRKTDARNYENRIAALNAQIQMLTIGHMQGGRSGGPAGGMYAGQMAAMIPLMNQQMSAPRADVYSDVESVDLPPTF